MSGQVGIGHWLEYIAFRICEAGLFVLPEDVAVRLGGAVGWFFGWAVRLRRRAVDEHLLIAFPDKTKEWRQRVALASYVHLGREMVVMFRMARMSSARIAERTRMVGMGPMQAAIESGQGVVLVTGHVGNWEIGGGAVAARGLPFDAVTKDMANKLFAAYLTRTRERLGWRPIDMDEAAREVLRSLKRGAVVALLADQNAHRSGIFVPFFGKLAATVTGPAVFAMRTGAPMYFGSVARDPGWPSRYTIRFDEIRVEATGDQETDIEALTRAHVRALEEAIRRNPEQYFWLHKRWKKRPAEEQPSAHPVITPHTRPSGRPESTASEVHRP